MDDERCRLPRPILLLGAAAIAIMVERLAREGKSAKHIALKIQPLQEAARSFQTEEAKER